MNKKDVDQKPESDKPKRILASRSKIQHASASDLQLETLLSDVIYVMHKDINKLKDKADRGATLEAKEGVRVRGYLESLIKANKDRRDADKKGAEEASKLSTEELLRKLGPTLTPEQIALLLPKDSK